MKLYDVDHRHEVATVAGDAIASRWGEKYYIDGYAVRNSIGEEVGTFDGRVFSVNGSVMAVIEEELK